MGPRGTGKSTWIRHTHSDAHIINLLNTSTALRFERNPESLRHQILAEAKPQQWIVIDEVQCVPALLDQIHICIEEHGYRNFLLTGSSARKLRKTSTNLLGGRARRLQFFPLTSQEIGFSRAPAENLNYGLLPEAVNQESSQEKELYLTGYLENYLVDEIKRESQLRNTAGFQRFLEVVAICSGSPLNLSNIARDAEVARDTVRSYFEVLEDTFIGTTLPAYRPRAKVKEIGSPKFYFFDSGVLNACAGYFRESPPSDWKGLLMETWIFHELRAYLSLYNKKGNLFYWRTPSGSEVDFVWKNGPEHVLIEVKVATRIHSKFLSGIKSFLEHQTATKALVVYLGGESLSIDGIDVMPVHSFLKKLHQHELIGRGDS